MCLIVNRYKTILISLAFVLLTFDYVHGANYLDDVLDAYVLFDEGQHTEALAKTKSFEFSIYSNIIRGLIYNSELRHNQALNEIKSIESEAEEQFKALRGRKELNASDKLFVEFYYRAMFVRGVSNYFLRNWSEALPDLIAYNRRRPQSHLLNFFIGVCYYHLGNIHDAIKYTQVAHQVVEDADESDPRNFRHRQSAAYNLAALYAVKQDPSNSIKWLEFPLSARAHYWLPKIGKEGDFDSIRDDPQFQEFLAKFR